jgi:Xaa-Pro aminopeptidase
MKEKRLDAVILTTFGDTTFNDNIKYYSGFSGVGIFILKKKPSLIVSAIELEKAKKTGLNAILITRATRANVLKKAIGTSKNIGIDKRTITLSQFEELKKAARNQKGNSKTKFFDISKDLLNIRAVKEKDEIKSVSAACKVCDDIFSRIIKNFNFKTEKELADFILDGIRRKGLEPSFNPIVSSGVNSSDVHHNPADKKIEKGFLILDFGCKVNGYCSDMTRTLYVGTPSEKEKKMYDELFDVQMKTLALVVVGKKCSSLDKYARDRLGERFLHNLGHGVGLEIHEQPNLTPFSKDVLEENMIITIEPGIYEEGKYGIRIEDTVLVTKRGSVRLTKSSKEMICVRK